MFLAGGWIYFKEMTCVFAGSQIYLTYGRWPSQLSANQEIHCKNLILVIIYGELWLYSNFWYPPIKALTQTVQKSKLLLGPVRQRTSILYVEGALNADSWDGHWPYVVLGGVATSFLMRKVHYSRPESRISRIPEESFRAIIPYENSWHKLKSDRLAEE